MIVIPVVIVIVIVIMVMVMAMIVVIVVVVMIVPTAVVVIEVVLMFVIVGTGPFEFARSRLFFLTMTLGFGATEILRIVFPRAYEIDRSVAGLVLVAVMPPVVRVFGWNVQVERCDVHFRRGGLDDYRTCVDNGWRRGTRSKIHATIYTRDDFSPDGDSDIQVTGVRDGRQCNAGQGKQEGGSKGLLHRVLQGSARANARSGVRGGGTVSTRDPAST